MDDDYRKKWIKKRKQITTRFLIENEYPQLLKQAKKAGYSEKELNKYMKDIAINGEIIIKKADLKEVETGKKLLLQIRKLGSNFNQTVRLANQKQGDPLSERVVNDIAELKIMISKIEKIYKK